MNIFLWDSYEEKEINDGIKYWVELWEDLIENFDNDSYGLNLVNPNLLLQDLMDEIRFNRLKNFKNKKYFITKLEIMQSDPVIKKFFKPDFTLIINELKSKRPPEYLIQLCEDIIKLFMGGVYFNYSCDFLKDLLVNSNFNQNDEENILLISQNLIVEFILIGYSLNTIKNMPSNLFDKYTQIGDEDSELLITKYPLDINSDEFTHGKDFNNKDYNNALRTEINSLSISDRIERIKFYFNKPLSEGYAILKVEGLKGNVDLDIGNVNFYKPKIENYYNDMETCDFNVNKLKYFGNEDTSLFINAAVKIKYRDLESAKKLAIESIDRSLDIVRCHIHSDVPFKIDSDELIIVDENGNEIGSFKHFSKNKPPFKKLYSCDLEGFKESISDDDNYFINIGEMLSEYKIKNVLLADKLIYSLHWYRKAFESNNIEDKLLNYWIVIENLVTFDSQVENLVLPLNENENKFSLIEELVPPIEVNDFFGRICIDLHGYLYNLINSSQGDSENTRHLLELPKKNIEACFLQPHEGEIRINIEEFINNISPLIGIVPNKIIKDKIIFADKFYSDNEFANQKINERLNQTKNDLLLIYRYRNLIVHNARFDNTILPYYTKKAERFAGNILRTVLHEFVMDNTKDHTKILLSKKVKIQRMMGKLKNNESIDLWNF